VLSAQELAAVVVGHSETLFGKVLTSSDFGVHLLADGTRRIYRVQPADSLLPVVIAKARSGRPNEDPRLVPTQTAHEFAVHSAVWNAMVGTACHDHSVPRPIFAFPEKGLLFMEQAPGEPIGRCLWRGLFGLGGRSETEAQVRRCGDWLHTFACRAEALPQTDRLGDAERLLALGRVNHHIYSLIGLSDRILIEAMLGQVGRRLRAYRVDPQMTRRIEGAFSSVFRDFGGQRDVQGNVHGKFSIADILVSPERVHAIDLEQAGRGSLYLDAAYFLYQLCMITRWKPFGQARRLGALRKAFLAGRSPATNLDETLLDGFIAYYLVNSLRPAGGLPGFTARARAHRWINDWLKTVA